MNGSHGFQFTPFGLLRGDQPVPSVNSDPMPAAPPAVHEDVDVERSVLTSTGTRPMASTRRLEPVQAPAARVAKAGPLTGKQIAAQCRARIREIEKALRAVPALQSELESLRRLLNAASRPVGRVVSIERTNAGSGR